MVWYSTTLATLKMNILTVIYVLASGTVFKKERKKENNPSD